MHHQADLKQAWQDGVAAVQQLPSVNLPREVHSVLGIAQLASAIRSTMDEINSPETSEDKFPSDLSRWRPLLPSDSYAAFDYYTDLLWGHRPPSDTGWRNFHWFTSETAKLSYVEASHFEEPELESTLPPSDETSHPLIFETTLLLEPVPDKIPSGDENLMGDLSQDEPKLTAAAKLVLYSVGAIFALIMAYPLRKSRSFTLPSSLLRAQLSSQRSFLGPSLVPLLRHDKLSSLRYTRPASMVAVCIPPRQLPTSRTLDPAIWDGSLS